MRQPARAPDGRIAPTVSSEYLRFVAMGVEGRGLDIAPLFTSSAIDTAVLGTRGVRVGLRAAERLWTQVTTRLRDPLAGLKLVETVPFGGGDLIDYLVRSSANVGASLEKLTRYAPLMSNVERMTLVVSGKQASVRFQTTGGLPHPVEMIVGLFARRSRDLVGPSWSLKQVSFAHEPLGPREAYERICQAPVRFGMPFTEAVFDRELLDLRMEGADPHLNAILTAQAEGLLASVFPPAPPRSFAEIIEKALSNRLGVGDFTLVGLADHLGLGVRTLQRRLRAEGLTHRDLVRKLRHDLARRSLAGSGTQNHIARTLGYSGTGAFRRAFKAWSGMPPAKLRGKAKRKPR